MKPSLFNTENVQAILENRKTVTRRVVKPQPKGHAALLRTEFGEDAVYTFEDGTVTSPHYRPGDIMYVRETYFEYNGKFYYKADGKHKALEKLGIRFKWHPSIHMPREAARIFLRVTDVRVERLQGMNMNDIQAEGVVPGGIKGGQWQQWQHDYMKPAWDITIKPKDRALYGWEANPWVWVIEFERISKEETT